MYKYLIGALVLLSFVLYIAQKKYSHYQTYQKVLGTNEMDEMAVMRLK